MKIKKTPPVDNTKPIRVHKNVHQAFTERAAQLSMERGKMSSMSLPDYLQEASAFFEANRTKATNS